MVSIQHSFNKDESLDLEFSDSIIIEVNFPQFSTFTNHGQIKRFVSSHKNRTILHNTDTDEYRLFYPLENLMSQDLESIHGFFLYHFIEILNTANDINQFALPFSVILRTTSGQELSVTNFEGLLYKKKSISSDYDRRNYNAEKQEFELTYGQQGQFNESGLQELAAASETKVYLLNKKTYELFKAALQMQSGGRNISDLMCLEVIDAMVDLSQGYPQLAAMRDVVNYTQVADLLHQRERSLTPELYRYLVDNFASLFDFPISLTAVPAIEVRGQLEIVTDRTLQKKDFDFYELSLEFVNNGEIKIIRYDWLSAAAEPLDNRLRFAFEDSLAILTTNISGQIRVVVKNTTGAIAWSKGFQIYDPALQNLLISIPANHLQPTSTGASTRPQNTKKLRGRVIQYGDQYTLNDLAIVIQAKHSEDEELFRIIGSARTDQSGNFSLDYPYGRFVQAQALVSLMPNSPADLAIDTTNINESIVNNFIFLLLTDENVVEADSETDERASTDDDCACHTGNKAHRLPDQEDLIASDEYTQDIGGSCLNLSTPNRTLREYSYNAIVRTSDPDVANYVLKKTVEGDSVRYDLVRNREKMVRGLVDLDNPIRWEDAQDAKENLSIYQAVTVATGHIIHYKSVFKADGYSLGDLVYSLPLAPGQKKEIVVLESAHSLQGSEAQRREQREGLAAGLVSDREITDQLSGDISEFMAGRSRAHTSGMSAGFGASGSYGGIGASLGIAGGFSNSNSSASQNSSRNIAQFFGERLRQTLMQNAESYRELNTAVVTTVTQGQSYSATSETVANHNHCHSLTMMYFQVLRHYAIYHDVSHVEECLFVPLLLTHFTTDNIHKWKDILAANLLPIPASTYLNWKPTDLFRFGRSHPLKKGFDANTRIKTDYERVDFPEGTYAQEFIENITGEFTLRVKIDRPKTRYDRILSFPRVERTIEHREFDPIATAKAMFNPFDWNKTKYRTTRETVFENARIFDSFMQLDADFQNKRPADAIRVMRFTPLDISTVDEEGNPENITVSGDDFFENDVIDRGIWEAYSELLGHSTVYEMLNNYFRGALISEWDRIFNHQIVPDIFEKILDAIRIDRIRWDLNNSSDYRGGEQRVKIRITSGSYTGSRQSLPDTLNMFVTGSAASALRAGSIRLDVENVRIHYTTAFHQGVLFNGYLGDDLIDGTQLYIPLNDQDLRNPKKEDAYILAELIEHLNSNLEHYNKVLWLNLDPDRRYLLLDGFNIQTYTSKGERAAMRSLASIVKNEIITIAGNALVFPVADGFKVSRQAQAMEDNGAAEDNNALIDMYKPLTPLPPFRLSVPTRGVFMEAIQGNCDACEDVKENSSQDWDRFRTEDTTPIQPITTPVPAISPYQPNYQDFAQPIVNIQNAPDQPAPAAGLAGLGEQLTRAGAFTDITGLAKNQDNAMQTYLSNQENAKAFAEMSKSLATQQHNTNNARDISQSIDRARRSGAISREEVQALTRQHLQQLIDGGESAREEEQFEREQNRPSLIDAAQEAINQGQRVSAEHTDPDGRHESLQTGGSDESTDTLRYNQVNLVAQPNKFSCWAAAMAMLINYERDIEGSDVGRITPEGVAEAIGISLESSYTWGSIVPAKEAFGFNDIPVTTAVPSARQWHTWLEEFGPLWVATGDDPIHAVVVYGIRGDLNSEDSELLIHNPWDISNDFDDDPISFNPTNNGLTTIQSVREFNAVFNNSELPSDWRILYIQVNRPDLDSTAPPGQAGWMRGVPSDMRAFRTGLADMAMREYRFWHTGGPHAGNAFWETDTGPEGSPANDRRERLLDYWMAAYAVGHNGSVPANPLNRSQALVQVDGDAARGITPQQSWSAVFICYCIREAGVTDNNVFLRAWRHVQYIRKAIENKMPATRNRRNPFWGYRINEYAPQVGDLVCRSAADSRVDYDSVQHLWRGHSHTDIVVRRKFVADDPKSRFIIAVGGNLEYDRVYSVWSDSARQWINQYTEVVIDPDGTRHEIGEVIGDGADLPNVSVGMRKIYLDREGKIDRTARWEVFNMVDSAEPSERVQYASPQSEYFAVIKVRTNPRS